MVESYDERVAKVTRRLRAVLDPQTDQERLVADWLVTWDLLTLEPLSEMLRRAIAEAYDSGYRDHADGH